jgi:beta-N-acetylhexosaminidase
MTAHVVFRGLDGSVPATLSRTVLMDLLRGELGYNGVILSDDLEMKAISGRYGMADATVGAVRAGCDAVLMCGEDQDQQARALEAVIRAIEDGSLPLQRAEDALTRHRRVKERFLARRPAPLGRAALREVLGRDEHQAVAAEMLRFA